MPSYSQPTGTRSNMQIFDNGTTVEFWMQIPGDSYVSDIPWAYTANGRTVWGSYNPPNGDNGSGLVSYRFFAISITYSQTVGFLIGDTNDDKIGGPTEFYAYINRGVGGAGVTIQIGNELKKAIPYVKENGVWKMAEPWSKFAGEWKQTI